MILPITPTSHSFSVTLFPPKSPPKVNNHPQTFTNFFEILNKNPTSNKREIPVAFRILAIIYHSDKYYDSIKEFTREEGEEKNNIQCI